MLGDGVTAVPDDDDQVFRVEGADRTDDVAEQRAVENLVQHLGGRGLHASAFARGKDDDRGRTRRAHAGGAPGSGCRRGRGDGGTARVWGSPRWRVTNPGGLRGPP